MDLKSFLQGLLVPRAPFSLVLLSPISLRLLSTTGELNETECDKQTCECDKNLTLCLKDQPYRNSHRGYLNVYCHGPTPNCSIYDPYPEEVTYGYGFPSTPVST